MTDILTKAQRSALMAKVKGSGNASTELRLVAVFRALGITGWRRGGVIRAAGSRSKVRKSQAGERVFRVRPDFVFPKLRLAVFVDGCFWHGCPLHATQPRQNAQFWREKIARNQARDRLVTRQLRANVWRVLRLWDEARQRGDGLRVTHGLVAKRKGERRRVPFGQPRTQHELTKRYERHLLARLRRLGLLKA